VYSAHCKADNKVLAFIRGALSLLLVFSIP